MVFGPKATAIIMSALALLVGYSPERTRRMSGPDGKHVRHVLPETKWFSCLLESHGLQHMRSASKPMPKPPGEAKVKDNTVSSSLLVRLRPGVQYEGPLTHWNQESLYLWNFFQRPADAYTIEIAARFKLEPPVCLAGKRRIHAWVWCPEIPPQLDDFSNQARNALGVTLEQWMHFQQEPLCIFLPNALIELAKRSAWSSLLFAASLCKDRGTPGMHQLQKSLGFSFQGVA